MLVSTSVFITIPGIRFTPTNTIFFDLQEFCTFCCTEQITDVYGGSSDEMHRFKAVIDALE